MIDGKVPYRLLVSLIENRRVDGKVRQEHIADLGSIDGHALPSIFDRLAFWHELDNRLARLSNRISADDAAKVRASVHERIPKPSAGDIERLELWNAGQEVEGWEKLRDGYQRLADDEQKAIAAFEQDIELSRKRIAAVKSTIRQISTNVSVVQQRLAQGDRSVIKESAEARDKQDASFLGILYSKAMNGG
jgi:hypothetical protein